MKDKERIRFLEEKLAMSFKDYLILEKLFKISIDALGRICVNKKERALDIANKAVMKINKTNA